MLNCNRNIVIFLALAIIAISICIHISLTNFNRDLGYQQPIEAFECCQTTTGWYISILNCSVTIEESQLAQGLQPITDAINNFSLADIQQYQQMALDKMAYCWQQAINSRPLETVRCLTGEIIDRVDSK